MTWIKTSDPLALLAIQAGQTPNPSKQVGAAASSSLDVDQRSIDIGEPVPIVFARRRNNAGGILVSPGATEARFENDASNNVTASYLLVLSEGRLDSIPVKDVLQRSCRVGSHTQTYNRRAGTWLPGNYITELVGFDKPEASYICGSIGLYPDMTTLSFQVTIPDGFDYWRRQVHVFVRGGMWVTRLLDSVLGPSDNFADLVQWMLSNSGRVPAALIDTAALSEAALFLEANGLTCNCWLQEAQNYSDILTAWSPYFLLGESNINGKKGLRPLLPTNSDGTLKITTITPEYTFTESEILPGTLEIDYTSWSDRQPFVAQMIWRQELGDDAAIIRTAEVQLSSNTSETGPYESHDLSAFCTSETHAVKAGAYILARRTYVSHTARFSARPQVHSTILSPGSIIRVALERNAAGGSLSAHDYFYQVERISKTLAGDVNYECSHFPVDTEQRSIVSQLVAAATGTGILLTSNSSGIGCDINSATDETIPLEEYIIPDDAYDPGGLDIGTDVATDAGEPTTLDTTGLDDAGGGAAPGVGGGGFAGGGFGLRTTENNPDDGADVVIFPPFISAPAPGDAAGVPPAGICSGARIFLTVTNLQNDKTWHSEVDTWSIPLTPPASLGLSDWNNTAIVFSFICPDGTRGKLPTYTWSDWANSLGRGAIRVPTVTTYNFARTHISTVYRQLCATGAVEENSTNTSTSYTSETNVYSVEILSPAFDTVTKPCGYSGPIGTTNFAYKVTFANGTSVTRSFGSIGGSTTAGYTATFTSNRRLDISITTSGQIIYPPIYLKI